MDDPGGDSPFRFLVLLCSVSTQDPSLQLSLLCRIIDGHSQAGVLFSLQQLLHLASIPSVAVRHNNRASQWRTASCSERHIHAASGLSASSQAQRKLCVLHGWGAQALHGKQRQSELHGKSWVMIEADSAITQQLLMAGLL